MTGIFNSVLGTALKSVLKSTKDQTGSRVQSSTKDESKTNLNLHTKISMNDRSRAPMDCFTLGELQLLSAIYHHLSGFERK